MVPSDLSAQERAGRAFPVSWDQFHRDCRALTWRLNEVGPFRRGDRDHPRRPGAGGDRGARTRRPRHRHRVHRLATTTTAQGELQVLKAVSADTQALGGGTGKGLLIVDDLVDTGATAGLVREMLPEAHFATVYAKPHGPPAGRHLHHRSVAGHLDLLSRGIWDCRSSRQ